MTATTATKPGVISGLPDLTLFVSDATVVSMKWLSDKVPVPYLFSLKESWGEKGMSLYMFGLHVSLSDNLTASSGISTICSQYSFYLNNNFELQ